MTSKELKKLLSGMFKNYMPDDIEYEDIQEFDDSGKAIPFSDDVVAKIEEPESMEEPEGMLTSNAKKESTALASLEVLFKVSILVSIFCLASSIKDSPLAVINPPLE